jgi:nucleoside-diphosphate-sugar epimerase
MKILLTGATGFVGNHLLLNLLNDGHTVIALLRNPSKLNIVHPKLKILKEEIDHPFVLKKEDLNGLEVVIHTAGLVHSLDTSLFYKTNADASLNIINALKECIGLKFILISSLAARGPFDSNTDAPISEYGKSKKMAEDYLHTHAPSSWIKIIIRPPMVIGPKDTAVLDIFKMVKSRFIVLPGLNAKKKIYSFVCVHDLVNTIVLSVTKLHNDALLYSAHDNNISFLELITSIKKKEKKNILFFIPIPKLVLKLSARALYYINHIFPHELRLTPDKVQELIEKEWTCSNHQCKRLLDQKFNFDLNSTIEITHVDYKERKWL